jgi:hypothetical protein
MPSNPELSNEILLFGAATSGGTDIWQDARSGRSQVTQNSGQWDKRGGGGQWPPDPAYLCPASRSHRAPRWLLVYGLGRQG